MQDAPLFDPQMTAAVALLLLVAIISCLIERVRQQGSSKKPAEYARLALFGILGACFGAAMDGATGTMCPEYFSIGKGIIHDEIFHWRVLAFGAQAGLAAGLVMGALLLFAVNPRGGRPPLPMRRLAVAATLTMGCALFAGILAACIPAFSLPKSTRTDLSRLLRPEAAIRFETVWRCHVGVYVGALTGLVFAVKNARKRP